MLGGPCITMTGVLIRREETQRHRCTWRECHVLMEPYRFQKERGPDDTLVFHF